MDAAAGGVERKLSDGNRHAAGPLVAQAEDAPSVCDDDNVHAGDWSAIQDGFNPIAIRIAHKQSPRTPVNVAELLARQSDHRCVDDWQHLREMPLQQGVEQHLVPVL